MKSCLLNNYEVIYFVAKGNYAHHQMSAGHGKISGASKNLFTLPESWFVQNMNPRKALKIFWYTCRGLLKTCENSIMGLVWSLQPSATNKNKTTFRGKFIYIFFKKINKSHRWRCENSKGFLSKPFQKQFKEQQKQKMGAKTEASINAWVYFVTTLYGYFLLQRYYCCFVYFSMVAPST